MRKTLFLVTLLASALMFLETSCSSDENEIIVPVTETITVSISEGDAVTVDGQDIAKEIIITTSAASDKNILVMLTPENAGEGEVTFASNHLLIAAGKTSAKTLVTFTANGFPADTPEKNIGITISSQNEHVVIGSNKTATFAVKGINGPEMVKLSVTMPDGESFDTTNSKGTANILFTLDSPLDFDLPITIQYAEGCDLDVQSASNWNPFPMSIPKGQLSAVQSITVNQGIAGVMKLKINLEPGDNVKLDQDKVGITFLKYEAAVTAIGGTNVRVERANSSIRTFTVALTNPAVKPVSVHLQLSGDTRNGASIDNENIVFAVGEQSKEGTITFSKDVFNSKDIQETITVTLTSTDVPITQGKNKIVYQVSGEKEESEKEQLSLEFKTEGTGDSPRDVHRMDLPYNNSGDGKPADRYDFWIGAKQAIEQMHDVVLDIEVQGFNREDYQCNDINYNGQYILKPRKDSSNNPILENWIFSIRFTSSAKGKEGKIVFKSNDATLSSGEIRVTVK